MIESAEEFVALRSSERPEQHLRSAHEPASMAVWRDVIARFPRYQFWVAQNKTVPVEILVELAHVQSAEVRCMVAMKRRTPESVLKRLARDSDETVRQRVVFNPVASIEVLELLLEDPRDEIRRTAAEKMSRGG